MDVLTLFIILAVGFPLIGHGYATYKQKNNQ